MEYYMDEKWKLCKEDHKHGHIYSHETSNKKPSLSSLPRSSSTKNPLKSFSRNSSFNLSRSSSQKSTTTNYSTHHNHKSNNLTRSSSKKCAEFTRKCSSMAKEQKAKFYIVKRCITMLLGWKKNDRDS